MDGKTEAWSSGTALASSNNLELGLEAREADPWGRDLPPFRSSTSLVSSSLLEFHPRMLFADWPVHPGLSEPEPDW